MHLQAFGIKEILVVKVSINKIAMSDIRKAIENFSTTIPNGSKILDVGCGLRPYEIYFTGSNYIGIDVFISGRGDEGKAPDYEFDGTRIPMPDNEFDVVICTEVLEHATDPDALLKEIARVSKVDGLLFLTVPFIWGLHELPYDFRRYTSEGIRKSIINVGYKVETEEKLTCGIDAIRLLVLSEVNNFQNNVLLPIDQNKINRRIYFWLQNKLFNMLINLWKKGMNFERIYIDNLVIAKKNPENKIG